MRLPPSIVTASGHAPGALEALRDSELWTELDGRARALGFAHFTFTAVPLCAGPRALGPLRVSSYPRAYVAECVGRGLYDANPGFAYAMDNDSPAYYGAVREYGPRSPTVRAYLELNRRFDVTRGILIPMRQVFGARSLLGLAFEGSDRELQTLWHDRREPVLALALDLERRVLSDHLPTFAAGQLPALTPRQRELLRLLADGHGMGDAAEQMGTTIFTADKHVAAARRALHARSTAQAVALALRFGLLE